MPIETITRVPPRGLKTKTLLTLQLNEFIGITNEIMPIIKLGGPFDNEKFDTFIYNMRLHGFQLEHQDLPMMDKLFADLKTASSDQRFCLNARIQILNLLEMRKNNWVNFRSLKNMEETKPTLEIVKSEQKDLLKEINEEPVASKNIFIQSIATSNLNKLKISSNQKDLAEENNETLVTKNGLSKPFEKINSVQSIVTSNLNKQEISANQKDSAEENYESPVVTMNGLAKLLEEINSNQSIVTSNLNKQEISANQKDLPKENNEKPVVIKSGLSKPLKDIAEQLEEVNAKMLGEIIRPVYLKKENVNKSVIGRPKYLGKPVNQERNRNIGAHHTKNVLKDVLKEEDRFDQNKKSESRNIEIVVFDDKDYLKISCSKLKISLHIADYIKSYFNTNEYRAWKRSLPVLHTQKVEIRGRKRLFTCQDIHSSAHVDENNFKYTKETLLAIRSQMDMDKLDFSLKSRGSTMSKSDAA